MLDGFVLMTPLLLLPMILLFVFAGCTVLFPFAGAGASESNFLVEFPRSLADEAAVFHVFVDIIGETNAGQEITRNLTAHHFAEEVQRYEFSTVLDPGEYTITCWVAAFDVHGRGIGEGHLIDSPPCTLTVGGGGAEVSFIAEEGDSEFTITGCEPD